MIMTTLGREEEGRGGLGGKRLRWVGKEEERK
jgi:hypothetical protein